MMINQNENEVEEEKKYVVYCHTNKINGKKYIGITCQEPEKRWLKGRGYTECPKFYNALKKYGWDAFSHELLFEGLEHIEALLTEGELIRKYKTTLDKYGYNISEGAYIDENNKFQLGLYQTQNYFTKNDVAPSFDEWLKADKDYIKIFVNLIKSCFGFYYEEQELIYDGEDNLISTKIIKNHKDADLYAVNILLENYGEEPKLQGLMKVLQKQKNKLEKEID